MKVFLDSNILFSASLGGEAFVLLWELAQKRKVTLLSSPFCLLKASTNLERKAPETLATLHQLLNRVTLVPESPEHKSWASQHVPDKDTAVLAAAFAANAAVLLTGDRRHFGKLMAEADFIPRVLTIREFLLRGSGLKTL